MRFGYLQPRKRNILFDCGLHKSFIWHICVAVMSMNEQIRNDGRIGGDGAYLLEDKACNKRVSIVDR